MGNQFPNEEDKSFKCIRKITLSVFLKMQLRGCYSLKLYLFGIYKNQSILKLARTPPLVNTDPSVERFAEVSK